MMRPVPGGAGYLEVGAQMPWRWVEEGQVLAWRDGTTIAFRDELVRILEWMSPRGLPPFQGVALVLAACRGKIPELEDLIPRSSDVTRRSSGNWGQPGLRHLLDHARNELMRLSALPREWLGETRGKCALLDLVFEQCPERQQNVRPSAPMLRGLGADSSSSTGTTAFFASGNRSTLPLAKLVQQVVSALKTYDESGLLRALKTGIESIPQGVDVGVPAWRRARVVMEELDGHPELQALSKLARNLMAAVQVPRRLTERDPLSIGGVADLSNRGPMDRLLLSELAHDDLTLMSRVALGEALYVRREPPAHHSPGTLILLLDQGIRMWGLPRLFAVAAALAVTARGVHYTRAMAWVASGHEIVPADLLTRAGLEQVLSRLEVDAHPGRAFKAFAQATSEFAGRDALLLTHRDVVGDESFRRALSASEGCLDFVGLVDRNGGFELHGIPMVSQQPICESHLDLGECLSEPGEATRLRDERRDPKLPAFLHHAVPPLLLPVDGFLNAWCRDGLDRVGGIVHDRQLIEFGSPDRGVVSWALKLPGGVTPWMQKVEKDWLVLRSGSANKAAMLVRVRPDGSQHRLDLFKGGKYLHAFAQGGVLIIVREEDAMAYAVEDGRLLDRLTVSQRWHGGRYFVEGNRFLVLTWDGGNLRMEPVVITPSMGLSRIVAVFDRQGCEGPWILNQHCQVVSLSSGEKVTIPLPLGQSNHWRDVQVSRDGHRVYTAIPELQWYAVFDLHNGRQQGLGGPLEDTGALEEPPPLPRWNVRRHWVAMRPLRGRGFQLLTRHGDWLTVEWSSEGGLVMRESEGGALAGEAEHGFRTLSSGPEQGWQLEVAEWGGGCRAVLDRRGLLHLRSKESGTAEMTLVLAEGQLAVWTSDQSGCGPTFFLPEHLKVDLAGVRAHWGRMIRSW